MGRVLAYAESQRRTGCSCGSPPSRLREHCNRRTTLVANEQVLELGANVGLPGLVARSLSAEVESVLAPAGQQAIRTATMTTEIVESRSRVTRLLSATAPNIK
jgi:hypothetical protein